MNNPIYEEVAFAISDSTISPQDKITVARSIEDSLMCIDPNLERNKFVDYMLRLMRD